MIIIAALFMLIGFLVKNRKMYNLIAGYNTMSDKEKSEYNIEGIATVFRNGFFGMAFLLILGYLVGLWIAVENLEVMVIVGATILGMFYIIPAANAKRYKVKNEENTP